MNVDKIGSQINDLAFYAWDCITLQVRGKWDVHLIIRNEKAMKLFIKLLIYKLNSMDGQAGSSLKY